MGKLIDRNLTFDSRHTQNHFLRGQFSQRRGVRNESNGDIEIRWLVPGPWGWIPEGEYLPRTRPVGNPAPRPLIGCLQYGNLGETTVGNFYGDVDEVW